MMDYMGYDAIAIGERELNYGVRNLRDLSDTYPLICSNLLVNGRRLLASSRIVRVGRVKVGIVSILGETSSRSRQFEVASPEEFLVEELSKINRKSDVLIVLAHMQREKLKDIVKYLGQVDLVIRGHRVEDEELEESCVDTISTVFEDMGVPVFFAGDRGRVLGKIDISWNTTEGLKILGSEIILLSKAVREDTVVIEKMKEFFRGEVKRKKKLKLREMMGRDEVTGKIREKYIGMDMCARCHSDIYDNYILTRHYRAFSALSSEEDRKNHECLMCHTTGFGEFGGYDPERERSRGVNLRGVQCEACHGPGTMHKRDGSYRKAALSSCRKCHTKRWSPSFDFETYWNRIKSQCQAKNKD